MSYWEKAIDMQLEYKKYKNSMLENALHEALINLPANFCAVYKGRTIKRDVFQLQWYLDDKPLAITDILREIT